jgi:hypothetical protein
MHAHNILDAMDQSDEINPGPVRPEVERRKQELAALLLAHNPALSIFPKAFHEIAAMDGITEAEARRKYRDLELNGPDDGNGIQMTLYDSGADVTVPFWHQGEAARVVIGEIWGYLQVLQRAASYTVYDPQLEQILDLDGDLPDVLACYDEGTRWTQSFYK